ncbi:hypothetical protein PCI56_13450 [Plesiomonas shigelloides subsp. oncorhynchi]|nr:hypothetical protein [Plesiomonas shigelloides]
MVCNRRGQTAGWYRNIQQNDLGNGAGWCIPPANRQPGVFPSDAQTANALFTSAFNTPPEAKDTVFTVYAIDGAGKITRTDSRMYNGTVWEVPKLFMDGNLSSAGQIRGDRLVAGTEINAQVIEWE